MLLLLLFFKGLNWELFFVVIVWESWNGGFLVGVKRLHIIQAWFFLGKSE